MPVLIRAKGFLSAKDFDEYLRLVKRIAIFDPGNKSWIFDPSVASRNIQSINELKAIIESLKHYAVFSPNVSAILEEYVNYSNTVVLSGTPISFRLPRKIPRKMFMEILKYAAYEQGLFRLKSVFYIENVKEILEKAGFKVFCDVDMEMAKEKVLSFIISRRLGSLIVTFECFDEYVLRKLMESCTLRYFVERALFDENGNYLETILHERKLKVWRLLKEEKRFVTSVGLIDRVTDALKSLGPARIKYELNERGKIPYGVDISFKLYPHQKIAYELWSKKKRGTIAIFTRGGKSFIAMQAIADLKEPTIIIVTTRELAITWKEYLQRFLGLKEGQIGYLGEGQRIIRPVTIGLYNSCVRHLDALKGRFELMICDECLTPESEIVVNGSTIEIERFVDKFFGGDEWGFAPCSGSTLHGGGSTEILYVFRKPFDGWLIEALTENGDCLRMTPTHPIYFLRNGMKYVVPAIYLKAGDKLIYWTEKSRAIEIIRLRRRYYKGYVYDLTTASHFFLFDGFLTHNCHHVPANTFKEVAIGLDALHRLALSATPKRRDRNEELLFALCGPLLVELDYKALLELKMVAPIEIFETVFVSGSDEKVKRLVEILRKHEGEKTIVFTQYLRTARELYLKLRSLNFKTALITGDTPQGARYRAFREFKEGQVTVIVTTTVLDEGITVPDAEVAVIYEGSGEARQMIQRIGRVLGYVPGKTAKIYEIIDVTNLQEKKAFFRRKWVRELYMFPEVEKYVRREKHGEEFEEKGVFSYQTKLDLN